MTRSSAAVALFDVVPEGITVQAALDHVVLGWSEGAEPHWIRRQGYNVVGFAGMMAVVALIPALALAGIFGCVGGVALFLGGAYILGSADDLVHQPAELRLDARGFTFTRGERMTRVLWDEVERVGVSGRRLSFGSAVALRVDVADSQRREWLEEVVSAWHADRGAGGEVDPRLLALRRSPERVG